MGVGTDGEKAANVMRVHKHKYAGTKAHKVIYLTHRQADRQADRASVSLLRRAYGQKWETTLDLTEDLG